MATLKDIARETGLKVETVSRILNNRGYISDSARERVQAAVKKLNYRPNELARSLSRSASNIIGLIVPHIEHPYFAELISHLEEAASAKGQQLFIFSSRNKGKKIREYLEACLRYQARGVILCSAMVSGELLADFSIPTVAIECEIEGAAVCICCDNREGGRLATEHLIAQGCRHLAHVSGVLNQPMPADVRCESFVEVCERAGVSHVEYVQDEKAYREMDYYAIIHRMLDEHPETDGIFASSDLLAAQVLQACAARGLRVPQDMRLVGFDDIKLASLTTPMLTTIAQPLKQMAEMAIAQLMTEEKSTSSRMQAPVRLIRRGTT